MSFYCVSLVVLVNFQNPYLLTVLSLPIIQRIGNVTVTCLGHQIHHVISSLTRFVAFVEL